MLLVLTVLNNRLSSQPVRATTELAEWLRGREELTNGACGVGSATTEKENKIMSNWECGHIMGGYYDPPLCAECQKL